MLKIFSKHNKTKSPEPAPVPVEVPSKQGDSSEHLQHLDALVMKRIQNAALDRWQKVPDPPALGRASSADIPSESQRSRTRRNVSRTISHNSTRRGHASTAAARLSGNHRRPHDEVNTISSHSTRSTRRTRSSRSPRPVAPLSAHPSNPLDNTISSHSTRSTRRTGSRQVAPLSAHPSNLLDTSGASNASSRGERRKVKRSPRKIKSRPETSTEKSEAKKEKSLPEDKKEHRKRSASTPRPRKNRVMSSAA